MFAILAPPATACKTTRPPCGTAWPMATVCWSSRPARICSPKTIEVELARTGRFGLHGSAGTAKLLMAGPGPAFHIVGTHGNNADPTSFAPDVWARQRMPSVLNVEIEGRHPRASGFLLEGTMQPTFEGVLLRQLEDGIRLHGRARNLLVSHCHIYNLRGVGVFLDQVNLHQAIIVGSHISYCQRGGIKILGSEIRNLQITGNDIEYNFDSAADASADIWIDCTADSANVADQPRVLSPTVREGTISSNTIQAKASPGGANIRILGHSPDQNQRAGMLAISGNLIGSQEVNVHLAACRGVVLSDNVIYSGHRRNLLVEGSRNIVIGPNSFDHNPDYGDKELCTAIRLADSENCTLTGLLIQDAEAGEHTVKGAQPQVRDALVEIVRCRRITMSGCQILDGQPYGVLVDASAGVSITGCTIQETRAKKMARGAIRWTGPGSSNYITGNTLDRGTGEALSIDPASLVSVGQNLISTL